MKSCQKILSVGNDDVTHYDLKDFSETGFINEQICKTNSINTNTYMPIVSIVHMQNVSSLFSNFVISFHNSSIRVKRVIENYRWLFVVPCPITITCLIFSLPLQIREEWSNLRIGCLLRLQLNYFRRWRHHKYRH